MAARNRTVTKANHTRFMSVTRWSTLQIIEIRRETLEKPRDIEAVDQRVVHLDGDRHLHSPALARAPAEHDARNRVALPGNALVKDVKRSHGRTE